MATLFDQLAWRDPLSGAPLEPIVTGRTPAGVPLTGALRVAGTDIGYPIVDCVARLTPQSARRYSEWLEPLKLRPPAGDGLQGEETVGSFGFQWAWNSEMRSAADLNWRVARRFQLLPEDFADRVVLDAGAGAGDQSRWLLNHGAFVVSADLSAAIDVVAKKLRHHARWFGINGDVTALPLEAGQFDVVYCEGVIQHTRDSAMAVRELRRVVSQGGLILATHYGQPRRLRGRVKFAVTSALRKRLSGLDRFALLWVTGTLAAASRIPAFGRLVRVSGAATYSDLMPSFRATWTNTFDMYGDHAYQRHVTPDEFWGYFEAAGGTERLLQDGMVIVARCLPT